MTDELASYFHRPTGERQGAPAGRGREAATDTAAWRAYEKLMPQRVVAMRNAVAKLDAQAIMRRARGGRY